MKNHDSDCACLICHYARANGKKPTLDDIGELNRIAYVSQRRGAQLCALETILPKGDPITTGPIKKRIPKKEMEDLFRDYTLDQILEAIIYVLRKMKDPEQYVFTFYLFAKRALREIVKE